MRVLDLTTGRPVAGSHGDFFALDPLGRAGVAVGTDALTGDVNADGVPDLVVGSGPGGPARVVVYSGKDGSTLADFRPFGDDLVSGVRVATAFVDDDPFADVVVGSGPGVAATVRVFSGKTFEQLPGRVGEFRPFGDGELGGVFVGASNDPPSYALPESAADAYAVVHDKMLQVNESAGLLGNDRDRDDDPLTARLLGPSDGKPAPQGAVTLELDGSFTYTPPAEFVGEDTFWYAANDGSEDGNPAPVTISVVQHNPVPLSDTGQFLSGTKHYGTVSMWDGDEDALTVTEVDPPDAALVLNSDGSYSYDPGSPGPLSYWFRYAVADSLEAGPVGVRHLYGVVPQPVAPHALGGAVWKAHDQVQTGKVAVSPSGLPCIEGCDPTYVYVTTSTQNGSIVLNKVTHQYTYTPNAGFVGLDYFAYQAKTGAYETSPAKWWLQVVQRRPVARADAFVTGQTTPITKSVATNDDDGDSDTLTFEVVSGVSEGKLEFQANGTFTYTPDADFVGVDQFTYKVYDGRDWTQPATAYVTVYEAPGASLGDYVWLDEDEDGAQDPTEKGIGGVAVGLLQYDYFYGTYTQTGGTTTNSEGWFSFNNLFSGKYQLKFMNPDTGRYFFTYPDKVSDELDSDAYPDIDPVSKLEVTGTTKTVEVGVGALVMHIDGAMRDILVDIDIDSNRDGDVTGDDEATEETFGTVVIADKDNVYSAPAAGERNDRALRKEVIVHSNLPAGSLVRVMRTVGNVKLYATPFPEDQGGNVELFGANDEITVKTEQKYYLAGGIDPSSQARGTLLKARPNNIAAAYQDQVAATVLWTEISGAITGLRDPFTTPGTYEYDLFATQNTGTENLGVQFGTAGSTVGVMSAQGSVRVDAKIEPKNMNWQPIHLPGGQGNPTQENEIVTEDGKQVVLVIGTPARLDYGFIFRREMKLRRYANGQAKEGMRGDTNDDSFFEWQDIQPTLEQTVPGDYLMIVDADAPTSTVDLQSLRYSHTRINFTEYVTFTFANEVAERCSTRLPWSFKADTAIAYDNADPTGTKPAFILGDPNNGADTNEVFLSHLASLAVGVEKANPTDAYTDDANRNKNIKSGVATTVVVTGTNLVGEFSLEKAGVAPIKGKALKVKRTDNAKNTSDLTEVKVTFETNQTAGAGYQLVVRNAGGDSTPVAGFAIVN